MSQSRYFTVSSESASRNAVVIRPIASPVKGTRTLYIMDLQSSLASLLDSRMRLLHAFLCARCQPVLVVKRRRNDARGFEDRFPVDDPSHRDFDAGIGSRRLARAHERVSLAVSLVLAAVRRAFVNCAVSGKSFIQASCSEFCQCSNALA